MLTVEKKSMKECKKKVELRKSQFRQITRKKNDQRHVLMSLK